MPNPHRPNHIMTEQEVHDLYDDNVTVSRRKFVMELLEKRVSYAVSKIVKTIGDDLYWYDYNNLKYRDDDSDGYFDPKRYKKKISFELHLHGAKSNQELPNDELKSKIEPDFYYCPADGSLEFPITWLSQKFETVLKDVIEDGLKLPVKVEKKTSVRKKSSPKR